MNRPPAPLPRSSRRLPQPLRLNRSSRPHLYPRRRTPLCRPRRCLRPNRCLPRLLRLQWPRLPPAKVRSGQRRRCGHLPGSWVSTWKTYPLPIRRDGSQLRKSWHGITPYSRVGARRRGRLPNPKALRRPPDPRRFQHQGLRRLQDHPVPPISRGLRRPRHPASRWRTGGDRLPRNR